MAVKKKKLDPATEKPEKKGDIDKVYIVEYTKLYGTPEQRAAMKKCIMENKKKQISKLTGKEYEDIQIKPVRDLFCEMFFPQFTAKKPKKNFFDLVDEL